MVWGVNLAVLDADEPSTWVTCQRICSEVVTDLFHQEDQGIDGCDLVFGFLLDPDIDLVIEVVSGAI
jgi:hypothetical protein